MGQGWGQANTMVISGRVDCYPPHPDAPVWVHTSIARGWPRCPRCRVPKQEAGVCSRCERTLEIKARFRSSMVEPPPCKRDDAGSSPAGTSDDA